MQFSLTVLQYPGAWVTDRFFCTDGGRCVISGIVIQEGTAGIQVFHEDGTELSDSDELRIGMNDFIPANNPEFFPIANTETQSLITAETFIQYLREINGTVDFEGCDNFFRCD